MEMNVVYIIYKHKHIAGLDQLDICSFAFGAYLH